MKEQALKEGKEEGLAEGLAEGIEKGQKKEKINNARRMLEKGYPIEDIAEITELTEEEIKNILK